MSHDSAHKTGWGLLLCSFAVNIFLVAFLLGRATMPPPPDGGHGMPFSGADMPPHVGPGPGRPPFMEPSAIFSPEELRQQFSALQDTFKSMSAQRAAFADKLEAGSVSRETVMDHLAAVDRGMDAVRNAMRSRIADKIGAMGPEERHHLAEALRREGGPPPACKP